MSNRTPAIRITPARIALAAGALALIGAAALTVRPAPLQASTDVATASEPADLWLKNLRKHRQLFDSPAPEGGILLIHMLNYFDTYNSAYGVKDSDISAVGTFYGKTTFHGLNDAMWEKYRIGEFFQIEDAGGKPATANPWRASPQILGMTLPQASVESLQKRGATFILCNNALTILSGMLAQSRGLDPAAVYADMKANILPGVELIPGMVIAIEQAHNAGMAYQRQ